MKTQEEKLQHVMEAAGECRHNVTYDQNETIGRCTECHNWWDDSINPNPSPSDLNELFRLAEKLISLQYCFPEEGIQASYDIDFEFVTEEGIFCSFVIHYHEGFKFKGEGDTPDEALLNALFIATGGVE